MKGATSPGAEAGAAGQGVAGEVGRRVEEARWADRRLIALVRARRPLYARSDLPAHAYHAHVGALWHDVAKRMGWTVAEVRRKWSHLRNSYSRHLRNGLMGARTARGRAVSRWHLADELAFLRDHMATDTRAATSYAPGALTLQLSEPSQARADTRDGVAEVEGTAARPESWGGSAGDPDDASFSADENSSYFQFFRGLHEEYLELPVRQRRAWRRACLGLLHAELDQADADAHADADADSAAEDDDDEERDLKPIIIEHVLP